MIWLTASYRNSILKLASFIVACLCSLPLYCFLQSRYANCSDFGGLLVLRTCVQLVQTRMLIPDVSQRLTPACGKANAMGHYALGAEFSNPGNTSFVH